MTREEIMGLEGRDLDWLVHKHVFRERTEWHEAENPSQGNGLCVYCVPRYSTELLAAWQVVERLIELGHPMSISTYPGYIDARYAVWIRRSLPGTDASLEGNDLPAMICRAALLAVCGEGQHDDT